MPDSLGVSLCQHSDLIMACTLEMFVEKRREYAQCGEAPEVKETLKFRVVMEERVLSSMLQSSGWSGRMRIPWKIFEKVFVSLIRDFRQSRLDLIQKKEERCMKETGRRDHMGLYEAERQTQGSDCQGISVKKRLCRGRRGTGGNGKGESKLSIDGI